MRSFIKVALALALACAPGAGAQDKDETKKQETEQPRLDIPIPPGHEAKELKLPYYDLAGKLRMLFHIRIAERVDKRLVKMARAQLDTFDSEGTPELSVDLPTSVLDLETSIVSSDGPVTIRRADFELSGDGMQFDTRTRKGTLTGPIRMLIYDRNDAPNDSGS